MTENVIGQLSAPFPWFGGKSRVADQVWRRFGDVPNYCEPFFGSGAVLLGRASAPGIETINDLDGYVANFWRAVQHDPEATAYYADNPVNECDLHARHCYLIGHKGKLAPRLMADPDYYDARVAGYWAHGLCCWIGSGFCSGSGPWRPVLDADGIPALTKEKGGDGIARQAPRLSAKGQGINRHAPDDGAAEPEQPEAALTDTAGIARRLPFVDNAGRGINRQPDAEYGVDFKRPHLMSRKGVNRQPDDDPLGLFRKLPHLGDAGKGVHRQLPHLAANKGCARQNAFIYEWFHALANRLRHVRVCCGDWSRIVTPSVTEKNGITGVFLDPPYPDHDRHEGVYVEDATECAYAARDWAIANGANPKLRIALCGYDGHWDMPDDWEAFAWKTAGGYGSQGDKTRPAVRHPLEPPPRGNLCPAVRRAGGLLAGLIMALDIVPRNVVIFGCKARRLTPGRKLKRATR